MSKRYAYYWVLLTSIACILAISFKPNTANEEYGQAIKKIANQLQKRKYKAHLHITFFNDYNAKTPLDDKEISIVVYDKQIHYKAGPVEAFTTEAYYVAIDHSNKTLLINKGIKSAKGKTAPPMGQAYIDSILAMGFNPVLVSNTSTTSTWRLTPASKQNTIAFADFTYDNINYTPKKIELYYKVPLQKLFGLYPNQQNDERVNRKQKPKMVIDYTRFELLNQPETNSFDFSNYIKISKGKPEKGPLAQAYKLIDFTNPNNQKQ